VVSRKSLISDYKKSCGCLGIDSRTKHGENHLENRSGMIKKQIRSSLYNWWSTKKALKDLDNLWHEFYIKQSTKELILCYHTNFLKKLAKQNVFDMLKMVMFWCQFYKRTKMGFIEQVADLFNSLKVRLKANSVFILKIYGN
jgi:fructose-1,6-bisphosphatase